MLITEFFLRFRPCHYICVENIGTLKVYVKCDRGSQKDVQTIVSVDYYTIEGSAKANEDFTPIQGTLVFNPEDD